MYTGSSVKALDRISIDPQVLGGQPVVRGTRLTVSLIVESIANGDGVDDLLGAYPFLTAEDIRQALLFAARATRWGFEEAS